VSYGTDLWCYDQLQTGRLASGVELVAQAIFRRLNTARGTLRDGDEGQVYGLDLLDFVGAVGTQASVDALPDAVVAEILKDDRVATASAFASIKTSSEGLVTVLLDVSATLVEAEENFTLTLSIGDVSVALLGVTTNG
jgi:hypothetical protein